MNYAERLGICAAASVAMHLFLARGTANLPPRAEAAPVVVRVELREPPPPPEPEPAPPEAAEPKQQPVHEAPSRRARMVAANAPRRVNAPKDIPPPTERPATTGETTDTPVFGISMESTSGAGTGPGMPVGNTLQTRPRGRVQEAPEGGIKPLMAPVQAYEVTKMPVPIGDCSGSNLYTEDARAAGIVVW